MAGLALIAVACVAAVGCGDDDNGSSGGSTSSATSTESAKQVSIAMVETYSAIPFYVTAKQGAETAAADDGKISLDIQAPTTSNGTNEANVARNMLADAPDGFAPNPCVLPPWKRVLADIASQQSPAGNVIAWGCRAIGTPEETSPVKTYLGVNDVESGRVAVAAAIDSAGLKSDATGTALVAACFPGVPLLDSRVAGAMATIKEKLPSVKIVKFATGIDQAKNTTAWASQLQNHPDTVFATGPCDADLASLLTLKKRDGGDWAVAAWDPNAEQLQAIEDGLFSGGVSTAPWTMAYATVALLAKGARGELPPEGWIDSGLEPINKDNAAEYLKAASSPEGAAAFYRPSAEKVVESAAANVKPIADSFK